MQGRTLRCGQINAISQIFIKKIGGGGGGGGMGVAGTLLMYTFTPIREPLLHSENTTRP